MPHLIRRHPPNTASPAGRPRSLRSARPRLLLLEDRLTPATFTVNSLLDGSSGSGNSGTLRYCIGQANTTPGDDTINISVNGTITLLNGQLTPSDTTGQTTIAGPGANLLTIDANFASRVFQINTGVTAEISGVTVTHGKVIGGSGGGINSGGTLTVANSTISGNSVSVMNNSGGSGGGIFNNSGTLKVTNSTISGNSANQNVGGGIYNDGTLTITNSAIQGNSAGHGGGIYSVGMLTVTSSSISGNHGIGYGGGIDCGGTVSLTNCTIQGNTAAGDYGGGIYGVGTLTNCTISGNTAYAGGGIAGGAFTVTDSTIIGNSSTSAGGGILLSGSGTVTITDSTISGNTGGYGGGIGNRGYETATITDCTIKGNSSSAFGGGICNFGFGSAQFTITNSTFTGNSADAGGGGISNFAQVVLSLMNSTVSGNSANGTGGGVYNHALSMTVNVTNTIIAGNQAPTGANLQGNLTTNVANLINMSAAAAGLGTLGNYGGPTQSIPLLPGSPAIDAGTSVGAPSTDQRGLPRYGPVDIGAFEVQPTPTTVAAVVVNDGSSQRSEVRSLTVTFSGPVTFAGGNANAAAAFQLQHVQDTTNIANLQSTVSTNAAGNTVVTITFTTAGNAATEIDPVSAMNGAAPSLADGRYSLTIFSANVTGADGLALNGANDYVSPADTYGGGPGELGLYRLFGDAAGNGVVDAQDLGQFRSTYHRGVGNALYLSYLDADNSGTVNAADLGQFIDRYNANVYGL